MANFKQLFEQAVKSMYPKGIEWDLVGILTRTSKVYTLSYDSKILSGIFEILCEPIIKYICDNQNWELEKGVQNQYPEFTIYDKNAPNKKLAIDIKSTYRQRKVNGELKTFAFTPGSYRSYIQDPKGRKGILHPYSEYSEHWVIGFLYDRNPNCRLTDIKEIIDAYRLEPPYTNIQYFIQEKFKISGKVRGSGNTTNIGSIKSNNIQDFENGNGPFKTKEEFDSYWKKHK